MTVMDRYGITIYIYIYIYTYVFEPGGGTTERIHSRQFLLSKLVPSHFKEYTNGWPLMNDYQFG